MSYKYDEESINAAERFIERIKNKTFKKQYQPNSSRKYPNEKASNSLKSFFESDQFKALLSDNEA